MYKYWIAYTDVDGFRVDTVKHMHPGATRFFTSVIHEFAQNIGKENFYLIGEITGGRQRAFSTLETTGMDAALGIDDIPDKLEYLVKGYRNAREYFDLFRNSDAGTKGVAHLVPQQGCHPVRRSRPGAQRRLQSPFLRRRPGLGALCC